MQLYSHGEDLDPIAGAIVRVDVLAIRYFAKVHNDWTMVVEGLDRH